MSESTAALFCVEAFYTAFAARDFKAMAAVWSATAAVSCIHPGGPPLTDRDEVMDSWSAILANPETPDIRALSPRVMIHGDTAIVTCLEQIDGEYLTATNVLVREGSLWKMVHHQAGPLAVALDETPEPAGTGDDGPIN